MKAVIVPFFAICLALGSCAQDIPQSSVPSVVVNAFNQQYSKATDIDWEMDGSNYKVEFEILFRDHDVWYDATGKVIRTKEDIGSTDLPSAVTAAITQSYGGYKIDDREKWTEGGVTTYMVELKTKGQERKVIFDAAGKVLTDVLD